MTGNFSLEYLEWLKESFLCQILATIIGASPCIIGVRKLLFWTDALAFNRGQTVQALTTQFIFYLEHSP